jgi:hypothetical protein
LPAVQATKLVSGNKTELGPVAYKEQYEMLLDYIASRIGFLVR